MTSHALADKRAFAAAGEFGDGLDTGGEGRTGQFSAFSIGSAFQPIFSLELRRPVGFEALLRARDGAGNAVPPQEVFRHSGGEADCIRLDRLCRTVHVRNFLADAGQGWLFLNVNPRVSVRGRRYGPFFREMLERHGMPPHRVVIEIVEGEIQDESLLAEAIDYYKELGCLVAIDDFGAGHSNLERIWRVRPDIVKLDRSLVEQAAESPRLRRLLPSLVGLIHESGSFALMEGVETEDQSLIVMDAGFDFVQGYYFGRPGSKAVAADDVFPALCTRFQSTADSETGRHRQALGRYQNAFAAAAQQIAVGLPARQACQPLLEQPQVERCYLLDMKGQRIETDLRIGGRLPVEDARFAPLADAGAAVCTCRPYFRRAAAAPGEVQITRPYLSSACNRMCVTLSIRLDTAQGARIFCTDLDWSGQAA